MKVLIASASRHGSTGEIAEAIANELAAAGLHLDVYDGTPTPTPGIDDYDAVVIGSAVYIGHWMPEARDFVEQHQEQLRKVPVWLFSSGPLGDEPLPAGDTSDATDLLALIHAREHRTFAGRLDRSELGIGEKLITRMVHAPEGDFRNWDEIRDWAHSIAAQLTVTPAPVTA